MQASARGSEALVDRRRLDLAQQQLRRMEAVAEGEMCREQALLLAVGFWCRIRGTGNPVSQ